MEAAGRDGKRILRVLIFSGSAQERERFLKLCEGKRAVRYAAATGSVYQAVRQVEDQEINTVVMAVHGSGEYRLAEQLNQIRPGIRWFFILHNETS